MKNKTSLQWIQVVKENLESKIQHLQCLASASVERKEKPSLSNIVITELSPIVIKAIEDGHVSKDR